jgi:hypothetical protein
MTSDIRYKKSYATISVIQVIDFLLLLIVIWKLANNNELSYQVPFFPPETRHLLS